MKKFLLSTLLFFNLTAFDAFVTPTQLAKSLNDTNLIILDISNREIYKKSHIKNAIHINRDTFFDDDMQDNLRELGIHANSNVIIYSHNTDESILDASFLAFTLVNNGFENVSLLNGGYMAWVFEYALETSSKSFYAQEDGSISIKDAKLTVNKEFVQNNLFTLTILDARTADEYYGIKKSKATKAVGHISSAKSSHYKNKFLPDNKLRVDEEIKSIYLKGYELDKDKTTIIYANTTFEASMEWFILYKYLNFKNTKIYEGSFSEWGNDANLTTTRFKWE